MKIGLFKALLLAAVICGASLALAESMPAPTPAKAPPRVPFTAFRTKPILKLHTFDAKVDNGSLVVQDVPEKKKKAPAKTIQIRSSDTQTPTIEIRPPNKPTLSANQMLEVPSQSQDDIIFSPAVNAPLVAASRPLAVNTSRGIPIPPRKPVLMQTKDSGDVAIERVMAKDAEAPVIQAPLPPATNESPDANVVIAPPIKPAPTTSVRIRDTNRFSAHERMGGSSSVDLRSSGDKGIRALGLPDDMKNLRLGSLGQGKGVSPVLIPGQVVTKAAPDNKKTDNRGIPSEVVVFFQEASADMEVGQLDVVVNDALGMLKSRPDLNLEIVGFAEPQPKGADATKKMSLSRALMIRQFLVRQGIDGDRLTVDGKGDNTKIEPRDRVEMYFER